MIKEEHFDYFTALSSVWKSHTSFLFYSTASITLLMLWRIPLWRIKSGRSVLIGAEGARACGVTRRVLVSVERRGWQRGSVRSSDIRHLLLCPSVTRTLTRELHRNGTGTPQGMTDQLKLQCTLNRLWHTTTRRSPHNLLKFIQKT